MNSIADKFISLVMVSVSLGQLDSMQCIRDDRQKTCIVDMQTFNKALFV